MSQHKMHSVVVLTAANMVVAVVALHLDFVHLIQMQHSKNTVNLVSRLFPIFLAGGWRYQCLKHCVLRVLCMH